MKYAAKYYSSGFTVAELLVSLAISAILASLTFSGFTQLVASMRIHSNVNNLVHVLHLARQTAWQHGNDVVLCASANHLQCDPAADWHEGWLLFSNFDRDNPPQRDPNEPIHQIGQPAQNLEISANRRAFVMRPFSRRSTNGTLAYCDRRTPVAGKAVIVSYTGKPRISATYPNGNQLHCASST